MVVLGCEEERAAALETEVWYYVLVIKRFVETVNAHQAALSK